MAEEAYTTEEGWQVLSDGHKVYTKTWKPRNPPAALLLQIHGFSDHCNLYYTFFPTLAARNIQCHSFDQRGWGRSVQNQAQRGDTGPTKTVLDDISTVLRTMVPIAESANIPLFLMGHSMGGGEVLYYAAKGPEDVRCKIRGYLAESPWIALHESTEPNRMTVLAGRVASKVLPKRPLIQKVEPKWVSRDEKVNQDFMDDELCHNTGTLEGFAGMLDRAHDLNTGAVVPTEGRFWIGHGDKDHVTSYPASKAFFERLKVEDKEHKTYPGWYHKLHGEPGEDKVTFANDVADWVLARSDSDSNGTKPKL